MCLVGKLLPCDACGEIKAKAAPITRTSDEVKKAKDVGERLFIDAYSLFFYRN